MRLWKKKDTEVEKTDEWGEKYSSVREKLFQTLSEHDYEKCDAGDGLAECGISAEMKRGDVYIATRAQEDGLKIRVRTPYNARTDGYFTSVNIFGLVGPAILQNRGKIIITEDNLSSKIDEILELTGRAEAIAYFNEDKKVMAAGGK